MTSLLGFLFIKYTPGTVGQMGKEVVRCGSYRERGKKTKDRTKEMTGLFRNRVEAHARGIGMIV